jgi:hydroxypyruvate isomerase
MKTSVCIEMIYTEVPFMERIAKSAAAGFDAIEFWNWDNKNLPAIRAAVEEVGIGIASFQANLGGTLIHPEQREGFVTGIVQSLEKAREVGSPGLFLLTDELAEDRSVRFQFMELTAEEKYESVLEGLKAIVPLAEEAGVTLVLEPLNSLVDHAGYFLDRSALGFELVRAVDSPRIKVLFDIYHMQVMEGNVIQTLTGNLDLIGHVHVADVPGRHEPGTGELNYANIIEALRQAGYDKYVGFEFDPKAPSDEAVATSLALLVEA